MHRTPHFPEDTRCRSTRKRARQLRVARAIRSGQVFVNNYGAGGGVELPFGGVKHSGYGREKGFEALYGFTTLKNAQAIGDLRTLRELGLPAERVRLRGDPARELLDLSAGINRNAAPRRPT